MPNEAMLLPARQADHPFIDGRPKQLYIDGKWTPALSGKTFDTVDPATGQPLCAIAEGGAEDIDLAVRAARAALDGPWSRFTPADRQRLLLRLADLLDARFDDFARLDTLDMGAPLRRTRAGRERLVNTLRFYAAQAVNIRGETLQLSLAGEYFAHASPEPIGVVGAIIPWNGPTTGTIWKIGPVLATGCTVVLKPAEEAPLTPLMFAMLCEEAGVPPGVINVVTGPGHVAGAALSAHPGVDKIAFTGSHVTGQHIVRASAGNLKKLSLELGGKSPDIVFADADLDAAVPAAAMAVFANSGQICSAGSRLFVQRGIYDEVVERVAAYGRTLKVGDGLNLETEIGPLVSAEQFDRVCGYLSIAPSEGARMMAGGGRPSDERLAQGYFVSPTVFADVHDDMRIAREEIFGPVISAIAFDDEDEVVRRSNDTEFGLGGGVWTRDVGRAHRVAKRLKAGSIWVNCYQAMDPALPFGGYKMSGYGKEAGHLHIQGYLNTKAVCMKLD
jgi:aldehyde dehydrogenase (NAD+)